MDLDGSVQVHISMATLMKDLNLTSLSKLTKVSDSEWEI